MQAASKFQVIDQHGRAVSLTGDGIPVFHQSSYLAGKATYPTYAEAKQVMLKACEVNPELSMSIKELDGDHAAPTVQTGQAAEAATGSERDVRTASRPPRGSSVYEEATDKPAQQADDTTSSPGMSAGGQGTYDHSSQDDVGGAG